MARSVWVLLLGGVLFCSGLTLAATRRPAPTRVASEYTLSLRVSDSDIWLGPPAQGFPQAAEVVVRVLDAQGQPVDGVPVEFGVEPTWTRSASLTPPQALTHHGEARAVFQAETIGVVRIMARVGELTQEAVITVLIRRGPGSASGGPNIYQ
jgi:hypothetical protein